MTRFSKLPIPPVAFVLLIAVPALSGDSHKCEVPVQECLNEMVTSLKTSGFIGIEYDDKKSSDGITVTNVIPETAAEKAGIQVGDVLKTLNGIRFAKDSYKEMAKVKLPGKEVTVTLETTTVPRHFHGVVRRFRQESSTLNVSTYSLEVVPWISLMSRTTDLRIFQAQTVRPPR